MAQASHQLDLGIGGRIECASLCGQLGVGFDGREAHDGIVLLEHPFDERRNETPAQVSSAGRVEQVTKRNAVASLIGQLTTHRQTLDICLKQLATHTPASAPPILFHQIDQARKEIALLKHDLAAIGMPVIDVSIDTPTPEEDTKRKAAGESQFISGNNKVQTTNSQVTITHLSGDRIGGNKFSGDKVMGNKHVHLSATDPLPPIDRTRPRIDS